MASKAIRKRYFVNFSIQFKYIMMSVLPVLLMSLFCIYFVIQSGELLVGKQKSKIVEEFSSIDKTLKQIQAVNLPKDVNNKLEIFSKRLSILQEELNIQYYNLVEEWAKTRMKLLAVLFLGMFFVGIISLIYSHRIAGPIYRLKKTIEDLQEGNEIGRIKVRPGDEFQDLANSLEKLRVILKSQGYLK
jgi:nitrogen fixation/metabolism regulation signal transduction histidine kinase